MTDDDFSDDMIDFDNDDDATGFGLIDSARPGGNIDARRRLERLMEERHLAMELNDIFFDALELE